MGKEQEVERQNQRCALVAAVWQSL